jgi:hypothetical protein
MIRVVVGRAPKPKGAEEIKWEKISAEDLIALATTPALFGGTRVFVFTGALAGERGGEFLEMLALFTESPHTFVFEEEKLLKAPTDALTKAGVKIEIKKEEKKEWRFDQFGVAAALGTHDKKRLWLADADADRRRAIRWAATWEWD